MMRPLSKDLPVPLYVQLRDAIQSAIENGTWKPGERIPSEDMLVGRFGVSKITVRQALKELSDLGIVRREQGRGTFVQRPELAQGPRELTSFTEEMRRHGWASSSKIIVQKVMPASAEVAGKLEIKPGEEVLLLRRLRLADGQPMGIQSAYLPLKLAPALERFKFSGESLYEVLQKRFGLIPAYAKERHTAVALGVIHSKMLGVKFGSPAMAVERVAFLPDRQPFEYVRSIMRGDRYTIVLDLGRESAGR